MAAKKKSSSKPKKAGKKKASAKKKTAKKAAKKKASAKKAAPKKTVAKKKGAAPAAKPKPAAKAAPKPAIKSKSGLSSMQVVMGHLFALRPRVGTGFRPDDFRRARQLLADESYSNIQEAARAVAERALDLTRGGIEGVRKPKRF